MCGTRVHFVNMSSGSLSSSRSANEGLGLAGVFRHCFDCGLLTIDERRRISHFNHGAENLTHLRADDMLNQPFEALPRPLQEVIRDTLKTGRPVIDRPILLRTADRGEISVCVSTASLRAGKGKGITVVAMLKDLTAVDRLEQNIQRLERLASLGTLSSSMAHEIKNALVAVKTFTDLLLEKNRDAELAEIVRRELCRVDAIVGQMLKFAGPGKLTFGTTRVHELLDQSVRMIQRQLEGKLVALRRSYNASPDTIKGNDHQLQQAFVNLFLNAVDAMGPNGELSVTTETVELVPQNARGPHTRKRPHLRLTIKDTGVGVAPENVARLFEPFFTTKRNGTGLGLAITRRIIQEHGGTISVESQVNQGTTFDVLFPTPDKTR